MLLQIESKVIPAKRIATTTKHDEINPTEPDDTNHIGFDDTNPTSTKTDTTIIVDVHNHKLHTLYGCAYALVSE